MFLRGGQDEDDVRRWLFQRFQKSVEGLCGEHVHLVDDKHFVFAYLWWDARLLHERLDVLHRVVACGIELEDIIRPLLVECLTALAVVAGLTLVGGRHAVDGLGKDTCASCFAHTSRTAEEIGVRQFTTLHCILQCGGERMLSHYAVEGGWAIFACRDDIFFHC